MWRNERGFSMLLAVVCLLIFSILGFSLLSLTSNAYSKNENRSNRIQADALATKGSDYIVAEINYLLKEKASEVKTRVTAESATAATSNREYDAYNKTIEYMNAGFDNILQQFSCDNTDFTKNSSVDNADKYGYCVKLKDASQSTITDDPKSWYTVPLVGTELKRILTLKSTGDVKSGTATSDLYVRKVLGVEANGAPGNTTPGGESGTGTGTTTEETVTNGLANVADIPVALQYALATKKSNTTSNSNNKENGSVFLHGGVDIFGGMNVEGNLYVGDYGIPGYKKYSYSSFPRIFDHDKNLTYKSSLSLHKPGTINIGGSVKKWRIASDLVSSSKTEDTFKSYHSKYLLNPNDYTNSVYKLANSSNGDGFSNTGVTVKTYNTEAQDFNVELSEIKSKFTTAFNANNISPITCSKNSFDKAFVLCNNSLDISENANLMLTKLQANSDLSKRGGIAYIPGSLNIYRPEVTIKGKKEKGPIPYVKLQGTYFIDGNLDIEDSVIYGDAVIYVTGKISVNSSEIHSLPYAVNGENHQGTLLMFAVGNIDLKAISANEEEPSDMKAFLYSKSDLLITGSTSHVLINGGISARSIELTAMRGSSTSSWKTSCTTYSNISNCQNISHLTTLWNSETDSTRKTEIEKKMRSRLTVYYNPDIIITYQQHAVETDPIKPPDLVVSPPSEYDRSKE